MILQIPDHVINRWCDAKPSANPYVAMMEWLYGKPDYRAREAHFGDMLLKHLVVDARQHLDDLQKLGLR